MSTWNFNLKAAPHNRGVLLLFPGTESYAERVVVAKWWNARRVCRKLTDFDGDAEGYQNGFHHPDRMDRAFEGMIAWAELPRPPRRRA
jgi:hypothetical protein